MVSEHLLQTKLQIPRRRTPAVVRSRLVKYLNTGLESRLILISAPAGFGKSTLLTEWLAGSQHASTWLSLDERDNDPALFMAYFLAALQKAKPALGDSTLGLLSAPQQAPEESVLVDLINEICAAPDHFIFVIDDYHLIRNQTIHKVLSFLVDNAPTNMHLVIASRSDPPFNLAHLRGRAQLTELRADDLRFTSGEIAEFLNRVMELSLGSEELALLDERSEGWIAGLQMAALTLKGRADTIGFLKALSTSGRNILDYLFEEVFQQQAEDVQAFLLQTSILDRLAPSLCDAVTQRQDSGRILDEIERANLFISPLDDELRWYHYHSLFKDLLQRTLGNRLPETVPVLHRRASEWYENEDLFLQAIDHALKAADYDRAAALIERRSAEILTQGELATYLGWMDSFPQSIIQMYPILILHRILAETLASGLLLEQVEAALQKVEELEPQNSHIKGAGLVVRAIALGNQADLSHNAELCRKALELLPPESAFWRGLATAGLRQYWLMRGRIPSIPAAIDLYSEAVETGQKIDNIFFRVIAQRRLAESHIDAGHLRQAHSYYHGILDVAMDRHGHPIPIASFGFFGLGILSREWNDLEKSMVYLERGIEVESGKLGHWLEQGVIELARTTQAQGDLKGAGQYLRKARQLLGKFAGYRSYESIIAAHELDLAIAQADMEKVNTWVRALDPVKLMASFELGAEIPQYIPGYHARELELLTSVRAYLAQRKPAEALKLLDALSRAAVRLGRAGVLLETNILYAAAFKRLGDTGRAMSRVKEALIAAEPEGYVRLFLDAGPVLSGLLYEAAQQGITPAYTHRLIAALPVSDSLPRRPDKSIKMEEPLSERELGVLNLLAQGLSNKQIGERLYIETRTVKWHTSNILGKLGVQNRTQAVAKARELGILKEDRPSQPKAY